MKTRLVFFACLAALALGFALGFSTSPGGATAAAQAAPPVSPEKQKISEEMGLQAGQFSNDERITRIFDPSPQFGNAY